MKPRERLHYPKAIQAFDQFRRSFPSREAYHILAVSHHQLALQAYRLWQPEAGPLSFRLSLAIDPVTRASRVALSGGRHSTSPDPALQFREHLDREATRYLHEALQLARRMADRIQIATVLGSLGEVYVGMRATKEATRYLDEALQLARTLGNTGLEAAILNTHGNLFRSQHQPDAALHAYQESIVLAKQARSPTMTVRALTHAAMVAIQSKQYQAAKAMLDEAQEHIQSAEPTHEKAYELLNIGLALH